jgi:response regulator RpfG family c-di-GMP phosphodiesterase
MKANGSGTSHVASANAASEHEAALSLWRGMKEAENGQRKVMATSLREQQGIPLIVVVDDEPVVAITLSEILRGHGANVVWFTEPLLALDYVRSHPVDLLISDITMPLMDGVGLAAQVNDVQPSCKLLLFSAVSDQPEVVRRVSALNLNVRLTSKPMQVACLMSTINEMLAIAGGDSVLAPPRHFAHNAS